MTEAAPVFREPVPTVVQPASPLPPAKTLIYRTRREERTWV